MRMRLKPWSHLHRRPRYHVACVFKDAKSNSVPDEICTEESCEKGLMNRGRMIQKYWCDKKT